MEPNVKNQAESKKKGHTYVQPFYQNSSRLFNNKLLSNRSSFRLDRYKINSSAERIHIQ